MTPSIEDLMKSAEVALARNDLSGAESFIDAAIAKIDAQVAKARHRVVVEHDDNPDASNPSMDYQDDGENDGEDDDGDDGEDDDGDNGNNKTRKAISFKKALETYPSTAQLINRNAGEDERPGKLKSETHVTSSNALHRFEQMALKIQNTEGVPPSQALHLARQRYPKLHAAYNGSKVEKGASRFSELVEREMAKGCSRAAAEMRVPLVYGTDVLRDAGVMHKADNALGVIEDAAQAIADAGDAVDRCDALRKARLQFPSLYKRLAE